MASQASGSISNECVFCLRQDWSYTCDAITDSEAGESYLKNHKICFNSLRVVYLSNKSLKTKGCCYCKGIYNSACNKREEKETIETRQICINLVRKWFYYEQLKFMLLTKEAIRRLNESFYLIQDPSQVFFHNVSILGCSSWQSEWKTLNIFGNKN